MVSDRVYRVQNAESGLVYRREGWGFGWSSDDPTDDLKVTYLAGYRLPEQTTANTLAMAQLVNPSAVAPMGETLPADLTRLTIEATSNQLATIATLRCGLSN